MTHDLETARKQLDTEKLNLAAKNLQHLLKIQDEQASLENITKSLQQTIADARLGVDYDFSEMLATQARILDATFHYYIDQSKGAYTEEDKTNIALKAQRQTVRAIATWNRLRQEDDR